MITSLRWLIVVVLLIATQIGHSAPIPVLPLHKGQSWNYRVAIQNQPASGFRVRVKVAFPNTDHQWVLAAVTSPPDGPESSTPPQIIGGLLFNGCLNDVEFGFSLATAERCASDPAGTSWLTSSAVHGSFVNTRQDVTDIKVAALEPESVVVPAGSYVALRVHANFSARRTNSTGGTVDVDVDYWFAPTVSAPVKVIRRYTAEGSTIAVLTEELVDTGTQPSSGAPVPSTPSLDSGYFLTFGRVYASAVLPMWIKQLCDEKYPATSVANQAGYDAWQQRNGKVIAELDAQFDVMQQYWASLANPDGNALPDTAGIRQSIEAQREPLEKKMIEARDPDLEHVCSALPQIFKGAKFDIETAHQAELAVIRRGPP